MRRKILVASFSFIDPAAAAAPAAPAVPSAPTGLQALPSVIVDPTDLGALILMALYAIRRMEIRSTDARAFPDVPAADFEAWKSKALHGRSVAVNASFAKFFLNNLAYYGLRSFVPAEIIWKIGPALLVGWLVALGYAYYVSASAAAMAKRLGIVIGRHVVEEKRAPRTEPEATESSEAGEASSR